jgi:argininosuccinate lyase
VADGRSLSSFSDGDLAALAPAIDPQAFRELLNRQSWLESKVSVGGTALVRVREQLAAAQAALAAG